MLTPWLHVILLAGYGAKIAVDHFPKRWKIAYTFLLVYGIFSSFLIAKRASFTFPSDARNPYAYSPTLNGVKKLEHMLGELVQSSPELRTTLQCVIGKSRSPLSWYIRELEKISYEATPPENLNEYKLLFVMPDQEDAVTTILGDGYFAAPQSLRYGYPITLFIRNDVWEKYKRE